MSTNDGLRQQSVRTITGTAYDYNGDWHALFDLYGVTAGPIDGRMLAWLASKIGTVQTNLTDAKNAYAVAKGVDGWNSLGTFSPGALFAPLTDLATPLKAWWSAADHGTANMTDDGAGLISTWKDRIGGLAVTATTTARPTWASNSFNSSYAGLAFDGVANTLVATVLTSLPTGATAGEIWSLCSQTDSTLGTATRSLIRYGGIAADTIRISQLRVISSANRYGISAGNGATELVDTATDFTGNQIIGAMWDGATTQSSRINGAAASPSSDVIAQLATGTTRIRIGAANGTSAAAFWLGQIRHMFITTALTAAQRLQLEGWIAWDSGLTSLLPTSHPYKTARP